MYERRLSDLERKVSVLLEGLGNWARIYSQMNTYFEAAGLGLRWENGDLVSHPELAHPAPNRNIEDYE